jgi:hypothetical protein
LLTIQAVADDTHAAVMVVAKHVAELRNASKLQWLHEE